MLSKLGNTTGQLQTLSIIWVYQKSKMAAVNRKLVENNVYVSLCTR